MDLLISLLCLCFSSEDEEATVLLVWHRSWVEPSHSTGGNSLHYNLIQTGWKFSVLCVPVSPLSPLPLPPSQAVVLEGKYWKRKFDAVASEYRKWRYYTEKKVSVPVECWYAKSVPDFLSFVTIYIFGVCRKGSLILPWLKFKREPLRYL